MNNLIPIKFKKQNVITTELLAEVYGTDTKNISKNFSRNIGKFEESKHYYLLEGEELKEFKGNRLLDDNLKFASKLYLWTERGANRHCKILDTDKAWEQFDNLEETYFRVKENNHPVLPSNYREALEHLILQVEQNEKLEVTIQEQAPKVLFADAVSTSKATILVGELAKIMKQNGIDTGEKRLFTWLRENGYLIKRKGSDYNMPTQRSMELKLFEVKESTHTHSDGHISVNKTTKVTGKGQQYFINKFVGKEQISMIN